MLERADRLGQSCPGPVRSKSDLPEVVEEAGEKVRVFQLIIQKLFNEINRFFFECTLYVIHFSQYFRHLSVEKKIDEDYCCTRLYYIQGNR